MQWKSEDYSLFNFAESASNVRKAQAL